MSTLQYDGIGLELVRTNLFTREPQFSDDGTSYLYTRFVLDVTCVFAPEATSYKPTDPPTAWPGQLATSTDLALRHRLLQPRKALLYEVGNETMLSCPADAEPCDARGGPYPRACEVREIAGSRTWLVHWRVEAYVIECVTDPVTPILSNRWSQSHLVDEQRLTTVLTRGVAVFHLGRLKALDNQADFFRRFCLPKVPGGCRRESVHVSVDPSGALLSYEVRDREMLYSLGATADPNRYGVESFTGVIQQGSAGSEQGVVASPRVFATLHASARGRKDSLRSNLVIFLVRLAIEQLKIPAGPAAADKGILVQIGITEHLHDRVVELNATVMRSGQADANKQGLGIVGWTDVLAQDVLDSLANDGQFPQLPNDEDTRGTFNGAAFAADLEAACAVSDLPGAVPGPPAHLGDNVAPAPEVAVDVQVGPPLDDLLTRISSVNREGLFTDMRIDTRYVRDRHRLQAAVTVPDGPDVEAAILEVAAPTTKKVVSWTAERLGAPPLVPHPITTDPNEVLLRDDTTPVAVVPAPDGVTPVYRVSGVYSYALRRHLGAGDALAMGAVPWATWGFGELAMPAENYVHGLIDRGGTGVPAAAGPVGEDL